VSINLPAETIEAYRTTRYDVHDGDSTISLRIGEINNAIVDLYRRQKVQSSAFITTWNPFGEYISADENGKATDELRKLLVDEGVDFLEGEGVGTDTTWPPEMSLLVLGISEERAIILCKHFNQNAVVFIGHDYIPVLRFHPDAAIHDIYGVRA